jgi:anaerobic glycerol-3-phosphate dehydrogenase
MRYLDPVRTEFLVIGGGAAGMLVAAYLAERRRDVAMVDTGTSCTALSTGCLNGTGLNEDMLGFLLPRLMSKGLSMTRNLDQTLLLGNAGNRYRCDLAPHYTALGTLESMQGSKLAVVGVEGNPEVDPELVCSILRQDAGLKAEALHIPSKGRISLDSLCDALGRVDAESIMLPPLFPLRQHKESMLELTERTGKMVFEPVTPLSLPGLRFAEAMHAMVLDSGCHVMDHRRVTKLIQIGGRYDTAVVQTPGTNQEINFSTLVLAGGNAIGPGLTVSGKEVTDPFEAFTITRKQESLSGMPLNRALSSGYEVDGRYRAIMNNGNSAENVYACGSALAGMSYPLGKGLLDVLDGAWDVAHNAEAYR